MIIRFFVSRRMLFSMAQSGPYNARTSVIAHRLRSFVPLTNAETDALLLIGAGPSSCCGPKALLHHGGAASSASCYIVAGWAAYSRELRDGRRQLIDILLPGDAAKPLPHMGPGQAIVCLTQVRTVDGNLVQSVARDPRHPGIARAIELAAEEERARLMNQVVRLGRLTAYERLASFFIELHNRFEQVGLTRDGEIDFPLTQEILGDLLGLSVVHVNRTLKAMRRDGSISLTRGILKLLDLDTLKRVGEYRRLDAAPRLDVGQSFGSRALT